MIVARRRPAFLPDPEQGESTFVASLLRSETVGGAIALLAAAAALVWANVDIGSYEALRHVQLGPLDLETWAADGALAIFFFVAGLELKREFLVGSLRRPADAAVPVVAAVCGVALPALIYLVANLGTENLTGWAIPAATDIAFALAVLAVVGSALPSQLRAFLLTLAVVDDLIVIVIIAVFYTDTLHFASLGLAAVFFVVYAALQRARVRTSLLYLPVAAAAWWFTHEAGIHATVAGVILGLLTRVLPDDDETRSPAERLEHRISPISSGVAVPIFAFLSAGVAFSGGLSLFTEPIVIGVAVGLIVGKPLGVMGGAWVLTRFTRAELNSDIAWGDVFGVALLAGVGFTVSLLVTELSFTDERAELAKTAVLLGSLVSALLAAAWLKQRDRLHQRVGTAEPQER